MKKYIINTLRKNRPLFLLFLGFLYISYLIIFSKYLLSNFFLRIILIIAPLIIFELLIRLLLFVAYGKYYRFAIFNYFFVNHKKYGYSFRKSINSAKINFNLLDKFIFKFDTLIFNKSARRHHLLVENKKDRAQFNTNSLGFRGKEFDKKKKDGVIRIFCSGGSTTAGNAIDDNETWPAILENKLRGKNHSIEVINAGVQGWFSFQELQRFIHEIINYNPDVILLHQGWNEESIYTGQNLGKWWRPKTVYNVAEARYLFCGKRPILSNTKSFLFFFVVHFYFNFIFSRNMKFTNSKRWESLKSEEYISAWLDNMACLAEEAYKKNILVYSINYPCLYDIKDSRETRDIYTKNVINFPAGRLAMDYWAITKKRIGNALQCFVTTIPCINTEKDFAHIRGLSRLKLFIDAFHMSKQGNDLLAESISKYLNQDNDFNTLLDKGFITKNKIQINNKTVEKSMEKFKKDDEDIKNYIERIIKKLQTPYNQKDSDSEVPTDRYATF